MDEPFRLHIFTSQAPSTVFGYGIDGRHVTRHDAVPLTEMRRELTAASILFLPLGFDTGVPEVIRTAAPAKLGEYLQSGRPILAHVPADSFVAHFCRRHECALVVDKPDVDALIGAMRLLARGGPGVAHMVAKAQAASKLFTADRAQREFWTTLDRIVADQRAVDDRKANLANEKTANTAKMTTSSVAVSDAEWAAAELPPAPILRFVGALTPLQGPDLLLDAFAEVGDMFPDISLLLVGPDRGMLTRLTERADALGLRERVHFRELMDLALRQETYRRAIALVVPARSAVTPVAAFEAAASGVPILATDACNFGKFAQIGGGVVVAANSSALAKALSLMFANWKSLNASASGCRRTW